MSCALPDSKYAKWSNPRIQDSDTLYSYTNQRKYNMHQTDAQTQKHLGELQIDAVDIKLFLQSCSCAFVFGFHTVSAQLGHAKIFKTKTNVHHTCVCYVSIARMAYSHFFPLVSAHALLASAPRSVPDRDIDRETLFQHGLSRPKDASQKRSWYRSYLSSPSPLYMSVA